MNRYRSLPVRLLFLSLLSGLFHPGLRAQVLPNSGASPESLGISSEAILNFVYALEKERKDEAHSFMLLRHGKIAASGWWAPYTSEQPHMLYSLSKSFTSTAIGIAVSEGRLSIDDPVLKFFPEDAPSNPSTNLKSMRVRDLLRMSTGHQNDATMALLQDSLNWVRAFLKLPVEHKPGTHFVYNSAATFMLSAIIQKVSGETLLAYLRPRIFDPLGISNPSWETVPQGINSGGWGLRIRTEDIARFGQLYLQKGMWNGKQLVSPQWIAEATRAQVSNGSNPESDWEQGYGYQFWRCRYNVYRGDGAFGQYCIVFPDQDAVLVITSGTKDMGAVMNLVWKHLLPALQTGTLTENPTALASLQQKLNGLSLSTPEGHADLSRSNKIHSGNYRVAPNAEGITAIQFNLATQTPAIRFSKGSASYDIPLAYGAMKSGSYIPTTGSSEPLSSAYAWTAKDTLLLRSYLHQTPYYHQYKMVFKGKELDILRETNVGFNPAANRLELHAVKE